MLIFRILLISFLPLPLNGCATAANYRQASATTERMEEIIASLNRADREIDETLNSLNNLRGKAGDDLRSQYQVFSRRVNELERRQRQVLARQRRLEAASRAYFASWERDLKRFRSPELRRKSRERRLSAIESFNQMFDALQVQEEAYRSILYDLKDIRRYLGYDLSPQSVNSLQNNFRKVNEDVKLAHQKISQAIGELTATRAPISTETLPLEAENPPL